MASLEDEMSRFEQEVLGAAGGGMNSTPTPETPRFSASQFLDVKSQLSSLRAQVYGSGGPPNRAEGPPRSQGPPISNGNSVPLPPPPRPMMPINLSGPPGPMGGPPGPLGGPPGPMGGLPGPMGRPPGPIGGPPEPMSGAPRMNIGGALGPPNHIGGPPIRMGGLGPRGPPQMSAPPQPPLMRPPAPPGFFIPHQVRPAAPLRPPVNQGLISSAPVTYQKPAVIEKAPVTITAKPDLKKPAENASESNDSQQTENMIAAQKRGAANITVNQDIGQGQKPQTSAGEPLNKKKKEKKDKRFLRTAANDVWEDTSLADWDADDFRVFCGDLGNEVTDEKLLEAFKQYPSLQKAKVVRDKRTHKTKGYGFISFKDPGDYTRAMREMNGKYVGNRPIKLRKSNWKDRSVEVVKKKEKEKKRLGFR